MMKNISGIGNNQKNIIQWASLPSIAPSIKARKYQSKFNLNIKFRHKLFEKCSLSRYTT